MNNESLVSQERPLAAIAISAMPELAGMARSYVPADTKKSKETFI